MIRCDGKRREVDLRKSQPGFQDKFSLPLPVSDHRVMLSPPFGTLIASGPDYKQIIASS